MPSFLNISTIYSKYSCTFQSSLGGFKILFHFVDRFPIHGSSFVQCHQWPKSACPLGRILHRDQRQLTGPKEVVLVKERGDQPSLGLLLPGPKALE